MGVSLSIFWINNDTLPASGKVSRMARVPGEIGSIAATARDWLICQHQNPALDHRATIPDEHRQSAVRKRIALSESAGVPPYLR
jgi:hypothetical protein